MNNKKRINSNLYTFTKLVFGKSWHYEELPDKRLYSNLRYPTKLTESDMPEWFVKGRYYKNFGFLNAKGVKHLEYKPNYLFNHFHKDDILYISYNKPIKKTEIEEFGRKIIEYSDYDYTINGNQIVDFVKAVEKYSEYDVSEIGQEIIKKAEWMMKTHPHDAEAVNGEAYIKRLKTIFK